MTRIQNQPGDVVSERSRDKHFAGRVLAGKDDVTVQEKEQVLDAVLGKLTGDVSASENSSGLRWKWRVIVGAATAVFAIVAALWIWNARSNEAVSNLSNNAGRDILTPKGSGAPSSFFYVRCIQGRSIGSCRPGARLAFGFNDLKPPAYFSAFAIRQTDDTVIWMFPTTATGLSVLVPPNRKVLKQAILIDEHYPPGSYEIVGLRSAHPLTREQIKLFVSQQKTASEAGASGNNLPVTMSRLMIEVKEP